MQQSFYLSDLLRNFPYSPFYYFGQSWNYKTHPIENVLSWCSQHLFSVATSIFFQDKFMITDFVHIYSSIDFILTLLLSSTAWKENDVARLQFSSDGSGMSYPKSDFWNHANMVLKGKLNKVFPNIFAKCHISIPKPRFRIPGSATNAILSSELQYISLHFVTVSQCVV